MHQARTSFWSCRQRHRPSFVWVIPRLHEGVHRWDRCLPTGCWANHALWLDRHLSVLPSPGLVGLLATDCKTTSRTCSSSSSMPLQLHREILSTHWVFQPLSHLLYQASSKQLSSYLTTSANLASYPWLSLPDSVAVASRSELTYLLHHLQLVDFLKLGHHHLDS